MKVSRMALALGVASMAVAGVAQPAVAEPVQLRVLQWNIAGVTINPFDESKPDNEGTLQVTERLVDIAESRQPHLVSMNEACARQVHFTRDELADLFGKADTHFVDSAGTDLLCDYSEGTFFESGTALLAVNADAVLSRSTFYFTDDGLITSTKTGRSAACMTVSFQSTLGQTVEACALHLDPDDERAKLQAQTFVNFMTEDGVPYPLVLAGDFNAPPSAFQNTVYAPEQGGQGQFVEVDHPANRDTFHSGGKIDYIFGQQDHVTGTMTGEVVAPGNCPAFPFIDHPCSDHSALFGTLPIE